MLYVQVIKKLGVHNGMLENNPKQQSNADALSILFGLEQIVDNVSHTNSVIWWKGSRELMREGF